MNFKIVLKSLGIVLLIEAAFMLPSLVVAVLYKGNDIFAFLFSILVIMLCGTLLSLIKPKELTIYARDGFAIVGLGWMFISFFGGLPFLISGAIPSLVDSLFESVSGFTTTGASILSQIEGLPRGILFWRSFTHWIGGMGVLVLTLAILPSIGARAMNIMKAESPGPTPGKLVPRVGQTAKILYTIYFFITLIEIILLKLAGMPLYDSCIHAFGTAGTGGFSNMNSSIGAYNNVYIDIIITVFMLIFGVNFTLYYHLIKGNIKQILENEELRLYLGITAASIILVTINIYGSVFQSIAQSFRYSSFQIASILTTTGYSTADFNQWPVFSRIILLMLMFIGGCAGSTGGGMKNIRILMLSKIVKRELIKLVHPRAVYSIRIDGKRVEEDVLTGVSFFFFAYVMIFAVAVLIVSIDGKDIVTSTSAVIATIGNIGPGLGMVGPMGNYSEMSTLSKLTLSMCMVIGRLEIFPILLLFVPSFWKKVSI